MGRGDELAAARLAAREAAIRESRTALRRWIASPRILAPWVALSAVIAALLLVATYLVALLAEPNPSPGIQLIAADPRSRWSDFVYVLGRNLTVLALHLMVCLATYLVRRSLPLQAGRLTGMQRAVHHHASLPALVVVGALTLFSLVQQALTLGQSLSNVAATGAHDALGLLVRVIPHAAPELIAVFLPLAAVIWLEREDRQDELLAAMVACTVIAVPVVVFSAWVEVVVASNYF
ncbi:MAG: stage II sporulation protein M [Solirubrobacteraceae bacterium]|nr:stage II sporulation protein M [Solirubrobacteraceae bacterium]